MRLFVLITTLLLAGCTAVPVKRSFPAAPDVIMQPCPDLEQIATDTTKLSDVLVIVTNNYSKYHQCQINQEIWVEWYTSQKKIFEEQ